MIVSANDEDRVALRVAELLSEKRIAGSVGPEAQAEAVIEDSDERTDGGSAPDSFRERRTSGQTVTPDATR